MGSLSSRPSVPSTPTVIAPQPVVPITPVVTTASTGTEDNNETDRARARTDNLLRRNRSRLGTIRTGFRGLLGASVDAGDQRKTLLGE